MTRYPFEASFDELKHDPEPFIELSSAKQIAGDSGFEVVACIGGRGFGVRREDMRKLLLATRGKIFTLNTLDRLVECTRLREFQARR